MPTDLIIIGDSHTRALIAGAKALGLGVKSLTLSGTAWFEADVEFSPETGLASPRRKWVGRSAAKLGAALGHNSPFTAGLPVILSCMNLGRMNARFQWRGHGYADDPLDLDAGDIPVSRAVFRAFIESELARPLELIANVQATGCALTVAAPPNFARRQGARDATAIFTDCVRALGATCFNPWEHYAPGTTDLPSDDAHRDGRHGNDAYGTWAMQTMLANNLIALPAPKAAKRA